MSVVLSPLSYIVTYSCLAEQRREVSGPRPRSAAFKAEALQASQEALCLLSVSQVGIPSFLTCSVIIGSKDMEVVFLATVYLYEMFPFLTFYVCLVHYKFKSCLSQKPLYLTIRPMTSEIISKRNVIN